VDRDVLLARHPHQISQADPLVEPLAQTANRLRPIVDPHVEAFLTVI
jgi:hypothetical protein